MMTAMSHLMPDTIVADRLIDRTGTVVEGAERVAAAVLAVLDKAPAAKVSLVGVRGVPSSFFNVVLLAVARRFGIDAASSRLAFDFGSDAQRHIWQRSLDTLRATFPAR
ncbi:MAG: hypothetical protein HMLKMBBP_02899 [Planctomycetes bacterium]|nr:hypothetical protein [Planctomycetota bacterium]